jgi:dynein heavy chain
MESRLNALIDVISRQIYTNISRGLFERDKLIFSFLITTSIMRERSDIDMVAWSLLLRGAAPLTEQQKAKILPNPMPKTILTDVNHLFLYSAELNLPEVFGGLLEEMLNENESWYKWANCETPQTDVLPGEWETKLDHFQKLIVLKAFRPEKISSAFQLFVLNNMGKFYTESPPVTMDVVFADTDSKTPMIFILSTGADPTATLLKFAKAKNQMEELVAISLG